MCSQNQLGLQPAGSSDSLSISTVGSAERDLVSCASVSVPQQVLLWASYLLSTPGKGLGTYVTVRAAQGGSQVVSDLYKWDKHNSHSESRDLAISDHT